MKTLRKVLFIHAAVWVAVGLAIAFFPRPLLKVVLGEVRILAFVEAGVFTADNGLIFARFLGLTLFVLALFMILVAQKIEAVWWWSWAFVLADVGIIVISVFHALFGLPNRAPAVPWLIISVVSAGFAAALLWGLYEAAQDQPIIDT